MSKNLIRWLLFMLAVVATLILPDNCAQAISYPSQADYDFLAAQGWANVPPEILIPGADATAGIGNTNPASWSSAAVISPNWVITAKHIVANGDGSLKPGWDTATALVNVGGAGGVAYNLVAPPTLHPTKDLALLNIRESGGAPANLPAAVIPRLPSLDDISLDRQRIAVSGYGWSNGAPPSGTLRWANGTASNDGGNFNASGIVPVPFYGQGEGQDSGGGRFYRNGWTWETVGINTFQGSGGVAFRNPDVLNWIDTVVGAELPVGKMPRPTADIVTTTGILPDPGLGQSVEVQGTLSVGGIVPDFNASDLYLNGTSSSSGQLQINNQAVVDVVGAVFVAPDVGSYGTGTLIDGGLNTGHLYVGMAGTATWAQLDGTIDAHSSVRVGVESGSQGSMFLVNSPAGSQLNTPYLVIGDEAGSTGAVTHQDNTDVMTDVTYVGYRGSGSYTQTGGTHTTERLVLAEHAGSSGAYTMTGGTLTANRIVTGGAFQLDGGTATVSEGVYSTGSGTVALAGSGRLVAQGIVAIDSASVSTSGQGAIEIGSTGLIAVSAAQKSSIDSGALNVVTNGQPIYEIGTTLQIPSQTVSGAAVIDDRIEVGATASLIGSGSGILATGGMHLVGGVHVDLGSNLIVPNGSISQLEVSGGRQYVSANVRVDTGGSLAVGGIIESGAVSNLGEFSVLGDGGAATIQTRIGGTVPFPGEYSQLGGAASLVLDFHASGADTLSVSEFRVGQYGVGDGGVLQLDVDQADVSTLTYGAEYPLVDIQTVLGGKGQGTFASIAYGDASWSDLEAASRIIAVLYDNVGEDASGINGSGLPVRTYDGIRAKVLLPGDFDWDNDVDQDDVDYFQLAWTGFYDHGIGARSYMEGDINGDGLRNSVDLAVLTSYVGTSVGGGGAAIPEPNAVAMLLAVVACGVARRRTN